MRTAKNWSYPQDFGSILVPGKKYSKVEKLLEFGKLIGWEERAWEWGKWKGEKARKGRRLVEKTRGMGGHFLGMTEEEREEIRKEERNRMTEIY